MLNIHHIPSKGPHSHSEPHPCKERTNKHCDLCDLVADPGMPEGRAWHPPGGQRGTARPPATPARSQASVCICHLPIDICMHMCICIYIYIYL